MKNPFRKSIIEVPEEIPDVNDRRPLFFEIDPSIREQIERLEPDKAGRIIATDILTKYVKSLNIVQLLCVYGDPWFEEQNERFNHNLGSIYYDEEWKRRWPLGEDNYNENIPEIVRGEIPFKNVPKDGLDLKALLEQINGIQKKLDKVHAFVESIEEVTMSGKAVFKLMNL